MLNMISQCWWRSWRGHDRQLTHEMDWGKKRFLTPSPILGIYIPPTTFIPGAVSRMQPWERKVLLRPSGLNPLTEFSSGLSINFQILAGRCRDLSILWLPQTSLTYKFPCLLNLQLPREVACFFLKYLFALHVQISPRKPQSLQTNTQLLGLLC